jgi:hypothetical protein
MFRPKNEEVTGNLRIFHAEEIHNSTAHCQIIKQGMRWMVHVANMEEERNPEKVLVGNSEEIAWKA